MPLAKALAGRTGVINSRRGSALGLAEVAAFTGIAAIASTPVLMVEGFAPGG